MSKRGFTFIEILVVFVVMGIVVAFSIPRLRDAIQKTNVRGAKVAIGNLMIKARAVAVARGCTATVAFTSGATGTVSITVCNVNGTGSQVLGGVDSVAARYSVTMTPSASSLQYDARGLSVGYSTLTVLLKSNSFSDSVVINQLGKVVRQ